MWWIIITFIFGIIVLLFLWKNFFSHSSVTNRSISSPNSNLSNNNQTIPGPSPADPKLGNFPDMKNAGSLHGYLVEIHKKFGPIVRWWWGEIPIVSIGSYQCLKESMKLFDRPVPLFWGFSPLIGKDSIQFSNYEDGRHRRKIYDPSFNPASISRNSHFFFQSIKTLCEEWKKLSLSNQPVLVQPEMFKITLESLIISSFGVQLSYEKIHKIFQAITSSVHEMELRLVEGSICNEGSERFIEFEKNKNFLKELIQDFVRQRKIKNTRKRRRKKTLKISIIIRTNITNICFNFKFSNRVTNKSIFKFICRS